MEKRKSEVLGQVQVAPGRAVRNSIWTALAEAEGKTLAIGSGQRPRAGCAGPRKTLIAGR